MFASFEQAYIPSEGEKARRATSSHLRRLFSDPNSSIPASPDLKATFNPLPSVPASPILGAAQGGEPRVAAAAQESGGSSIMSLLSESTTMSPTSSSEGLPAACDVLPDMPALRLTAENVAILGDAHKLTQPTAESAGRSSTATRDSIVVKPTADEDNRTDSDSTVCAEPPRTMTFRLPDDENRSESEEAVSQRPIKARRPRPVPSIASEYLTGYIPRFSQTDTRSRLSAPLRRRCRSRCSKDNPDTTGACSRNTNSYKQASI